MCPSRFFDRPASHHPMSVHDLAILSVSSRGRSNGRNCQPRRHRPPYGERPELVLRRRTRNKPSLKREGFGDTPPYAVDADAALKAATCMTHAAEPLRDAVAL